MHTCDLIIIGAGPAGMSAAINAGSEGLLTTLVDKEQRFGGQAGTSTLIENLIGFPDGVSGEEITRRAITQAAKFKVDFKAPFLATNITRVEGGWSVCDDDYQTITCRVLLVTAGISYKALEASNIARFIGQGVSYGSPSMSENYSGKTAVVVGGANSAGQAAIFLAKCLECTVKLVVRASSLEKSMSTYLIDKIKAMPNIEVLLDTEVLSCEGDLTLRGVNIRNNKSGQVLGIPTDKLYVLIGAKAKTSWLNGILPLSRGGQNDNGYILTGSDARTFKAWRRIGREPLSYESIPGIFAAGDIRYGSIKRVVSAAGEGAGAVNDIHRYLAKLG